MSENVLPFRRPPPPPPGRYAVVTKHRGARLRVRSQHDSIPETSRALSALILDDEELDGLVWGAVFDTHKGKPGDPKALIVRVEHQRRRAAS